MKNTKKLSVSVLIPCHNEAKSIAACIQSCLKQSHPPDEIVVANDGSTDNTAAVLDTFGDAIRVISISKATRNKSRAQEYGLTFITGDICVATDGDTILDSRFVERVVQAFQDTTTAAFGGYVKSLRGNWLTACRELDYIIGQNLYKKAQSYLNALFVIPGCAGAFRTNLLKKELAFDHDTLTEDLDITFKLHGKNRRIVYDDAAIVYTQDPASFSSYINQMRRWYSGGWQNIKKHYRIFQKPTNALQLSLTYIEGLISSVLLFVTPILNIQAFLLVIGIYIAFGIILGTYAAITRKRWDLLLYSPLYVVLTLTNAWIFLEQFVQEIIIGKKNLIWFHPERTVIN